MITVGSRVRRARPGKKLKGGKDDEMQDDEVGREGNVTREFSWKWMKIDAAGEAEWVRFEDFEEV